MLFIFTLTACIVHCRFDSGACNGRTMELPTKVQEVSAV